MSVKQRGARTALDAFRQSGSIKCLFPRVYTADMQAVLVNTAGGVTGGDYFCTSTSAASSTNLTLTTQACERAYRAQSGEVSIIRNKLQVAAHARANWLPQETLIFDGSALNRCLSVELAEEAEFLMVEPLIFGRAAMGETVRQAFLKDRIDIRREGTPLYLDAIRLKGDAHAHLAKPFIANGATAMASVVFVSQSAESYLKSVRQMLPETAGVSLLLPDVLVLRLLAKDGFDMRQHLIPILHRLSGAPLPRCWTI